MQRFDAHAIACQDQVAFLTVEQCEGEHAVQAADHLFPPLFVCVRQHLGVGLRVEGVAGLEQLFTKLEVVVNLAVLYDEDGLVLVVDRLMAAFQVNDREASHSKGDALDVKKSFVVGTSM